MTAIPGILISLLICGTAAVLEGACAGKNIKAFFATLRFPRYSAPLWVWTIIGGVYYAIFFSIIYRLLRLDNYVIFRARNLYLSFVIGAVFPILDLTLFALLMTLDQLAALALIPYLLYRVYAVLWGYGLWRVNQPAGISD